MISYFIIDFWIFGLQALRGGRDTCLTAVFWSGWAKRGPTTSNLAEGGGRWGGVCAATFNRSILLSGGQDAHIPDTALGLFRLFSGFAITIFGNFLLH